MNKLKYFLPLVLLSLAGNVRAQTAGCGATTGGVSQYDQTQCGNVEPFPAAPSRAKPITRCGSYGPGTYQLQNPISAGAGRVCITWREGPVTLDFNGYTVSGQMLGNITLSGSHLYSSRAGGGLTCSIDQSVNTTNFGCIWMSRQEAAITSVTEIDHLTLSNTIVSTQGNGGRVIHIDGSNASASRLGSALTLRMHNLSGTSSTNPTSGRIVVFNIQSKSDHVEYSYNDTLCLANANACQGMICYGTADCKMHNNRSQTQLLTVGSGSNAETSRNFLCDADAPPAAGMMGCEVYNNYINANDGRAVRWRDVSSRGNIVSAHDNLIDNIQGGSTGNYIAAFHICDPDNSTNDGTIYKIYNNTLNFKSGVSGNGLMARGCTGYPTFQNNFIHCVGGSNCAGLLTSNRRGYAAGSLTIKNNAPVNLNSSPQNTVEATNTTDYCNSGTVGGAGTTKAISCGVATSSHLPSPCPSPGVSSCNGAEGNRLCSFYEVWRCHEPWTMSLFGQL